jgi:prepilin-type N-terminal cleavage/methylation domain-containing protein
MKTKLRRQQAFTLLEIMVALGLLTVIIIAIYSSWTAIIKGSRVAREVASASQRSRITMRTLQDSLLCACMFQANPSYYTFLTDSSDDYSSFSFVARLPKSFPRSGKFGDLDVRRLSFSIENSPDNGKQLVLRQNPILMEVDKDEQENPLVLAKDVDKFIVEYIDPKTGDWISDWQLTNQLPREVRIQLALGHADNGKALEVFVGTVAMAAQPVQLPWQMPMNAAAQLGNGLTNGAGGISNNVPNNIPNNFPTKTGQVTPQ